MWLYVYVWICFIKSIVIGTLFGEADYKIIIKMSMNAEEKCKNQFISINRDIEKGGDKELK